MEPFIVDSEQPIRLDVWLSGKLGQSRSQIQKLIKSGNVLVNGKERTPHFEVRNRDTIQLLLSSRASTRDPDNKNKKEKNSFGVSFGFLDSRLRGNGNGGPSRNNDIEILFESPGYLVVEKPIGLVVHPDAKYKENTLIDLLREKYPEIKNVGELDRPGVVHRLDKEVSGLLVIARNQQFYEDLRKQFNDRGVMKEYLALVFGEIKNQTGTITFKITRSKDQEKYIGLPPTSDDLDALNAETSYEVVASNPHYSLVRLFPKTGRTHQLRVHMRTFGHPIVGDRLYDLPHWRHLNCKFSRVMLHARRIKFQNLAGESVQYESSVPNEMATTIEDIFHVKDF